MCPFPPSPPQRPVAADVRRLRHPPTECRPPGFPHGNLGSKTEGINRGSRMNADENELLPIRAHRRNPRSPSFPPFFCPRFFCRSFGGGWGTVPPGTFDHSLPFQRWEGMPERPASPDSFDAASGKNRFLSSLAGLVPRVRSHPSAESLGYFLPPCRALVALQPLALGPLRLSSVRVQAPISGGTALAMDRHPELSILCQPHPSLTYS